MTSADNWRMLYLIIQQNKYVPLISGDGEVYNLRFHISPSAFGLEALCETSWINQTITLAIVLISFWSWTSYNTVVTRSCIINMVVKVVNSGVPSTVTARQFLSSRGSIKTEVTAAAFDSQSGDVNRAVRCGAVAAASAAVVAAAATSQAGRPPRPTSTWRDYCRSCHTESISRTAVVVETDGRSTDLAGPRGHVSRRPRRLFLSLLSPATTAIRRCGVPNTELQQLSRRCRIRLHIHRLPRRRRRVFIARTVMTQPLHTWAHYALHFGHPSLCFVQTSN